MPTALPPIPEESFDQHNQDQFAQTAAAHQAQMDAARQQQDQAAQQEFARTADAQLGAIRSQQEQADARRAFYDTSDDHRAQVAQARAPQAPAMPGGADSGGAPGAQLTPRGDPLQRVYADARAAGLDDDAARAAVAVAQTEQGYAGAQGDRARGGSRGTFQFFFGGGMGNEYARQRGISAQQADAELATDPHSGNRWALAGYLGDALRAGQAKGLSGADLATYAQQFGQRSVRPELAGQGYQAAQDALGASPGGAGGDRAATASPDTEAVSRGLQPRFGAAGASPERSAIRQRAEEYVGTPYLWGGADKQGIDCSAFISRAWGTARQTTDTLGSVADPIPKEELTPGDALNLTTAQDPRGYGHVRMFDGWADAARTQRYVYESSTATGGVARRVIPYDAAYTPMRLRGLGAGDPTAYQVAMHERAPPVVAEQATPSRPTTVPIQPEEMLEEPVSEPFARRVAEVRRPVTLEDVGSSAGEPIQTPNRWHRVGEAIRDALSGAPWNRPEPPTPADVGAAEGDRPPGEFDLPSDFRASERIARAAPPPADADIVQRGLYAGGQFLLDRAEEARRNERILGETRLTDLGDAAATRRALEAAEGTTLALSGEPVVGPSGEALGAAAREVARLRLDKIPEAARATVLEAAQRGDFWRPQRRYVISDAEAERMADELGRTIDEVVAGGRMGRAYNTEELRALKNAVTGQALRVDDLKLTVEALGDAATPALRQTLAQEQSKLLALSRIFEGGRAEAGRAMRVFLTDSRGRLLRARGPQYTSVSTVPTRAAPELEGGVVQARTEGPPEHRLGVREAGPAAPELGPAVVQSRIEGPPAFASGTRDPGTAAAPLGTAADVRVPTPARQIALPGAQEVPTVGRSTNLLGETTEVGATPTPSWYDRWQTLRFAGMLSSTVGQLVNVLSTGVNTLADPAMKLGQVGLDVAASRLTGAPRERYLAEVGPQTRSLLAGILTGAKKIPHIMRTGIDPETAAALEVPHGGLRSGSARLDTAVETPLRALSAADAMWCTGATAGHAAALATRQAIKEGLTGAERAARVDYILSNLHEFKGIADEAGHLGARAVFQEHRGEADAAIKLLKGTPARYVSDILLPFIRIPYNIAAQGAGMTPAGFAGAIRAAKTGQRGEAIDRAVRAGVGTGALTYGLSLAAGGYLTPAMPDDPAERSTRPDGWKPDSLRIPAGDGAVYIPRQMLGPVAMPLAVAAALGDMLKRGQAGADPEKLAWRSASAIGKYVGDQAFLQGLRALPDIIDEPERYFERFSEQYARSQMPFSALQQQVDQFLGRAPRDPKGALEGFLAASPLTSGLVEPRRTALGAEREQPSGWKAFVAGTRVGVERDEPVLGAYREAGVSLPPGPASVLGHALTPEEQRRVGLRAGELIRERTAEWATDPEFRALGADERADILRRARDQAREDAGVEVLDPLSGEELARRREQMIRRGNPLVRP